MKDNVKCYCCLNDIRNNEQILCTNCRNKLIRAHTVDKTKLKDIKFIIRRKHKKLQASDYEILDIITDTKEQIEQERGWHYNKK